MSGTGKEVSALSDADYYRMVRSQIEFEAGLITQRLSWFVASQAFLFSAYAITLNAPREPATTAFGQQQHLVYHLIPVVAVATCALIYLAILAGIFAQVRLREFLLRRLSPERLAEFPLIQGSRQTHLVALAAQLGLPMVFVAVWLFLFARGLS